MHVRRVVAAGLLVTTVFTLGLPGQASSSGPRAVDRQASGSLPPEFTGTLTVSFDVTALESGSDLTPGHYDQSHLVGSVTLAPQKGSTSSIFDPYLFSSTPALSVTSTVTRYAPDGDCQNHSFVYGPATGYADYPAYFSVETPERAKITGHRWGLSVGSVVGAQTNGCPGQDGNWPVENLQEYVTQLLGGLAVPDTDPNGGRTHLVGSRSLDLSFPPVAQSNAQSCAADGVYYDPCFTSWQVDVSYDLRRISADDHASQYPHLRVVNDARGKDVIVVRTDTPVPHTQVVVYRLVPGSPVLRSMGPNPLTTDAKGVLRLVLRDSQKSKRRWFMAFVDGTARVLPGLTTAKAVR